MTEQAEKYVNSLDLDYKADFVPFSQSRNNGDENVSLNWRITIGNHRNAWGRLTTDYMQGIGHLPGHKFSQRLTVYENERQRKAAETGLWAATGDRYPRKLPAPKLIDVLYCLVSDASVLDCATFEDWADELGYDTDSRKAEKISDECLKNALALRQYINLDDAREAFQDY